MDQETRRPVDSFFLVGISTGFAVGCLKEGHFVCELKKNLYHLFPKVFFPNKRRERLTGNLLIHIHLEILSLHQRIYCVAGKVTVGLASH